jgi:hypothetical protein
MLFFSQKYAYETETFLSVNITKQTDVVLFTLMEINMANDRHLAVSINDYIWIALSFDQSIKN